jgi:hypothetical protein
MTATRPLGGSFRFIKPLVWIALYLACYLRFGYLQTSDALWTSILGDLKHLLLIEVIAASQSNL